MKTMFKIQVFAFLLLLVAGGCKKQDAQIIYQGGTSPALSLQQDSSVTYVNAAFNAVTLSWTNPDYKFNTGVSSLDVTYNIEIDTAADFSNPSKKIISVSKDLSYTFVVSDLNDVMLNQLQLQPGVSHTLLMRVVSTMTNSSAKLISNVVQLVTMPYAIPPKVTPPSSGQLFLVGDATAGGWNNPVPVPTQEFTKESETLYDITVNLVGGKEYLFLPVNGDWSHKYAVKDNTVSGLNGGGDFGLDYSKNFPGPSAGGNYKITVDFQRGVFTVKPQ